MSACVRMRTLRWLEKEHWEKSAPVRDLGAEKRPQGSMLSPRESDGEYLPAWGGGRRVQKWAMRF